MRSMELPNLQSQCWRGAYEQARTEAALACARATMAFADAVEGSGCAVAGLLSGEAGGVARDFSREPPLEVDSAGTGPDP